MVDFVDRALGIYEADQKSARVRTFNPFFWLGLVLDYVVNLPFQLVRRAGFNPTKFEASWAGRLTKFAGWLFTGAVAIATLPQTVVGLLQAFGWWEPLLVLLGIRTDVLPPVP